MARSWARVLPQPDLESFFAKPLTELISLIESAANAESEDLRRLSFHSRDLTLDMSAKHLVAILVPFERLQNRALRDDEFLVHEKDAVASPRRSSPLVVVADNIRSAFNVGAILRTSEALGAERVVLAGYTPTPNEEKNRAH